MTQDPWGHGVDRGSLVMREAMFLAIYPTLMAIILAEINLSRVCARRAANSYLLTAYVGVAGRRSLCSLSLVNQRQLPLGYGYFYDRMDGYCDDFCTSSFVPLLFIIHM
jgi:hypothetical protein